MFKILSLMIVSLNLLWFFQVVDLDKKIDVSFNNITLKEALEHLQNENINLSYVDNKLPLHQLINFQGKGVTVKQVISNICQQTGMEYHLVGNQLVLKPAAVKTSEKKKLPVPDVNDKSKAIEKTDTETPNDSVIEQPKEELAVAEMPSTQEQSIETKSPEAANEEKEAMNRAKNETANQERAIEKKQEKPKRLRSFKPLVKETSGDYEIMPYHLGFIYPISTNGIKAGQYVNNFNMHILAGYGAGLDGIGLSGLANVNKDFVKGVQFAGLGNITGRKVDGALQFAGVMNVTGGNVDGAQFAGVGNINNGTLNGAQIAGVMNVVADSSKSAQFAGVFNVVNGRQEGFQAAGVFNASGDVNGGQVAGVMNLAVGDVKGTQIAGVINAGRRITGSQIGLINLADTVTGVPIGFLSLVRKGYHHVELWTSESFNANAAIKLGVPVFYNIFALSVHLDPDNTGWAFGYGVGSQANISKAFKMNFDLLAYQYFDDNNRIHDWEYYNILNQFRWLTSWQLAKHLSIYAGPTFNVQISDADLYPEGVESPLAPYNFYDETFNNQTNVKMWIGFNAGLRF